ncbi:hypothetical protein JCM19274_3849 [Algibacter lectus]|uniref:PIN domain protein n=1 Tax=Algibacter lectus TaxID=221126 RepID=A0A090X0D8_9FLAO|nr:DUF4411 family protein [Algibacter lectus]GAL82711.1 hypothetical protein JCM19274_3849 [Algibacter lectus]
MKVYVVDSNFFIQAHRVNYPLDVAFSFWNKVKELADSGRIISIDKVKDELYDKNDALEDWCKANLPEDFFKSTDEVMAEYGSVTAWAISMNHHYLPNALNEFLAADEADAFLVAYSLADNENRIIVTHEVSQPARKNRVKIPEACAPFNVRYLNTIEMLREIGETF